MEIEAARAVVEETPLPLAAEAKAPPQGSNPPDPLHDPDHGSTDTSRVRFRHIGLSTTKTGYTERNILTCIEVVPWALQSSM
jgi:hypothetical protein